MRIRDYSALAFRERRHRAERNCACSLNARSPHSDYRQGFILHRSPSGYFQIGSVLRAKPIRVDQSNRILREFNHREFDRITLRDSPRTSQPMNYSQRSRTPSPKRFEFSEACRATIRFQNLDYCRARRFIAQSSASTKRADIPDMPVKCGLRPQFALCDPLFSTLRCTHPAINKMQHEHALAKSPQRHGRCRQ